MTTIGKAIAAYRTIAGAENKSPKTIERVASSARYLKEFLGGDPQLDAIGKHDMRRWINALKQRTRWADHPTNRDSSPLSASSIATYVRSVQLLLRPLHREELIPRHQVMDMQPPKEPRKVVQAPSSAQLKAVFQAADMGENPRRDGAILFMFLDTGPRLSEPSGATDVILSRNVF